ncbi:MAG: chromosomal replication initiator protein DnaA [Proteobacteria bacterium]|nr:chromosomal replication initiator protein DnaA [Pseudomonadota bacterium]
MVLAQAELRTMDDLLADAWERISQKLNAQYGDAIFRSWLKPIRFAGSDEGRIQLSVPTRFVREWVSSHYGEQISSLWMQEQVAEGHVIEFVVPEGAAAAVPAAPEPVAEAAAPGNVITAGNWASGDPIDSDLQMGSALDPRYTFENYVVGKPNELAHAAARRVAETANVVPGCNPLFLYGGVGLGKTHLMHAIAWHIRRNHPNRRVLYLSAEKFMYQFIKALRFKETLAFKEQLRSVDVLMIDDVQFISGKDSTQEEFFHTFNALVDQNKQLIISCDRSPSDLEDMEERVRSRLGWGLVADIHATTYELRLGILQSKVEQMTQAMIPQKVLEFLAHKITSNVRELEGALNRVVAHATLVGRPVTLETTQDVLQDLLRANDRRISIEDIQKQVAGHYNIKVSDMHSARRSRVVARPRQVAMYLSKKLTSKSLPEIGRKFGGKDHTTVMHAVKRIEELMATDNDIAKDIELLERILQN